MDWLGQAYPHLVADYRQLYRRGAYLPAEYRAELAQRAAPLIAKYRLAPGRSFREAARAAPSAPAVPRPAAVEQPALF